MSLILCVMDSFQSVPKTMEIWYPSLFTNEKYLTSLLIWIRVKQFHFSNWKFVFLNWCIINCNEKCFGRAHIYIRKCLPWLCWLSVYSEIVWSRNRYSFLILIGWYGKMTYGALAFLLLWSIKGICFPKLCSANKQLLDCCLCANKRKCYQSDSYSFG